MRIELKLFATLRQYLPAGSEGGRANLTVDDGLTIGGLLDMLKIPQPLAQMTLINGLSIEGDFNRKLKDGDVVSIFPPIAGG